MNQLARRGTHIRCAPFVPPPERVLGGLELNSGYTDTSRAPVVRATRLCTVRHHLSILPMRHWSSPNMRWYNTKKKTNVTTRDEPRRCTRSCGVIADDVCAIDVRRRDSAHILGFLSGRRACERASGPQCVRFGEAGYAVGAPRGVYQLTIDFHFRWFARSLHLCRATSPCRDTFLLTSSLALVSRSIDDVASKKNCLAHQTLLRLMAIGVRLCCPLSIGAVTFYFKVNADLGYAGLATWYRSSC